LLEVDTLDEARVWFIGVEDDKTLIGLNSTDRSLRDVSSEGGWPCGGCKISRVINLLII
jgi:hypothetical protein